MHSRLIRLMGLVLAAGLLLGPARALAWQDLDRNYVRDQVERIAAPQTPDARRRALTWTLVSAGRAAVHPLGELARTSPRLLPTCVVLLDLDAFSGPPRHHRALRVRDEGEGRWLVRTAPGSSSKATPCGA